MRKMIGPMIAMMFLVAAAPAAASSPAREITSRLETFVDDEECGFPVTITVDLERTTTTFANGDVHRHAALTVTHESDGNTVVEPAVFNVFIPHDSPTLWTITGLWGKVRADDGGLLFLQSGRIFFDLGSGQIVDPRPGPLGEYPDICAYLGG